MAIESQVVKRAEIDTRPPFRSVKEAVVLFGERVSAGDQVHANKLIEEMPVAAISTGTSKLGTVASELEETRESLKKAIEESSLMSNCLTALKEELEQTKRELQQLKAREYEKQSIDSEIEDLKFVENATEVEIDHSTFHQETEFQSRYVKFADAPSSLAQVVTVETDAMLERHPSLERRKKKMKHLIPLIGGIFTKKKGIQEVASPQA